MKFATIYLDQNKIEIDNSITGKETISLNGSVVSQKHSVLGAKHQFYILENQKKIKCQLNLGYGPNGVVLDLYKDGQPIIESYKGFNLLLIIVISLFLVFSFFAILDFVL